MEPNAHPFTSKSAKGNAASGNVCLWPKADLSCLAADVCSRRKSGHSIGPRGGPKMTHATPGNPPECGPRAVSCKQAPTGRKPRSLVRLEWHSRIEGRQRPAAVHLACALRLWRAQSRKLGPWDMVAPAPTGQGRWLALPEKVRFRLLSLRQPDLATRTSSAPWAQNPPDFADVFVRENSASGISYSRSGPENAFFSATFVPAPEVQFSNCRKPKRVRAGSFRIHLPQATCN